jgi:hypothetical protein
MIPGVHAQWPGCIGAHDPHITLYAYVRACVRACTNNTYTHTHTLGITQGKGLYQPPRKVPQLPQPPPPPPPPLAKAPPPSPLSYSRPPNANHTTSHSTLAPGQQLGGKGKRRQREEGEGEGSQLQPSNRDLSPRAGGDTKRAKRCVNWRECAVAVTASTLVHGVGAGQKRKWVVGNGP